MNLFSRDAGETEQREREAAEYVAVFSDPRAFRFLVKILTVLKWRGTLVSSDDVSRHNASEEIMALFGGNDSGIGWSQQQFENTIRSAMGQVNRPERIPEGAHDVRP